MTERKTTSTNFRNEIGLVAACPMTFTNLLLGKRWKPIILWKMHLGCATFTSLQEAIPLISRKMLFEELRSLQEQGLISTSCETPSKAYELTGTGLSLVPLLEQMESWGVAHREAYLQKHGF